MVLAWLIGGFLLCALMESGTPHRYSWRAFLFVITLWPVLLVIGLIRQGRSHDGANP